MDLYGRKTRVQNKPQFLEIMLIKLIKQQHNNLVFRNPYQYGFTVGIGIKI